MTWVMGTDWTQAGGRGRHGPRLRKRPQAPDRPVAIGKNGRPARDHTGPAGRHVVLTMVTGRAASRPCNSAKAVSTTPASRASSVTFTEYS